MVDSSKTVVPGVAKVARPADLQLGARALLQRATRWQPDARRGDDLRSADVCPVAHPPIAIADGANRRLGVLDVWRKARVHVLAHEIRWAAGGRARDAISANLRFPVDFRLGKEADDCSNHQLDANVRLCEHSQADGQRGGDARSRPKVDFLDSLKLGLPCAVGRDDDSDVSLVVSRGVSFTLGRGGRVHLQRELQLQPSLERTREKPQGQRNSRLRVNVKHLERLAIVVCKQINLVGLVQGVQGVGGHSGFRFEAESQRDALDGKACVFTPTQAAVRVLLHELMGQTLQEDALRVGFHLSNDFEFVIVEVRRARR